MGPGGAGAAIGVCTCAAVTSLSPNIMWVVVLASRECGDCDCYGERVSTGTYMYISFYL